MTSVTGPLSADTIDALRHATTATLASQLFKRGFRNVFLRGLRPLCPQLHMVGVATTLRFVPAREDLATYERLADPGYPQRHAIEHIAAGHVLVADCRGVADAGAAGEILIARLQARGAAGLVADGGIRDWETARSLDFPVYALGPAAPAHVARHLAIDVDVPIACAEVLVMPGDVLVGDGDGVVCVPRQVADAVAAAAREQDALEAFVLDRIKAGAPLPGTYPPNEATRAEYEASRRRPSKEGR
jgi:regulator of RNase E activity RraA